MAKKLFNFEKEGKGGGGSNIHMAASVRGGRFKMRGGGSIYLPGTKISCGGQYTGMPAVASHQLLNEYVNYKYIKIKEERTN